jgi:hypothetical protein
LTDILLAAAPPEPSRRLKEKFGTVSPAFAKNRFRSSDMSLKI